MILILIILLFFLFIRKNCKNKTEESFNNVESKMELINGDYFKFLKNDTLKKQSVRNLLF